MAEDCGGEPRLLEIDQLFGSRVAHIVHGCSDSLSVNEDEKAPWRERKEAHIEHLKSSDFDTLLVTGADKTHNARAIVTDLQSIGVQVWERFNADPEEILWYYNSIYQVLSDAGVTPVLLNPLQSAIELMEIHKNDLVHTIECFPSNDGLAPEPMHPDAFAYMADQKIEAKRLD